MKDPKLCYTGQTMKVKLFMTQYHSNSTFHILKSLISILDYRNHWTKTSRHVRKPGTHLTSNSTKPHTHYQPPARHDTSALCFSLYSRLTYKLSLEQIRGASSFALPDFTCSTCNRNERSSITQGAPSMPQSCCWNPSNVEQITIPNT